MILPLNHQLCLIQDWKLVNTYSENSLCIHQNLLRGFLCILLMRWRWMVSNFTVLTDLTSHSLSPMVRKLEPQGSEAILKGKSWHFMALKNSCNHCTRCLKKTQPFWSWISQRRFGQINCPFRRLFCIAIQFYQA